MHDTTIYSNLDSLLVAIPFLVILLIGWHWASLPPDRHVNQIQKILVAKNAK